MWEAQDKGQRDNASCIHHNLGIHSCIQHYILQCVCGLQPVTQWMYCLQSCVLIRARQAHDDLLALIQEKWIKRKDGAREDTRCREEVSSYQLLIFCFETFGLVIQLSGQCYQFCVPLSESFQLFFCPFSISLSCFFNCCLPLPPHNTHTHTTHNHNPIHTCTCIAIMYNVHCTWGKNESLLISFGLILAYQWSILLFKLTSLFIQFYDCSLQLLHPPL